MKTKTELMYATMHPRRLFFIVALPGMVSMFAMSVYTILEGIFIGQILGEGAFAAVNIAMPLVMINFSLADLVGVGASVPISIALGRGDKETANNVFSCSVLLIVLTSLGMGLLMLLGAEPLAAMMGARGELLETSVRYLRVCAAFSPIAAIFFAMDNYLKISGFVRLSMVINIGCNLLTIALLSILLLACSMDVVGSALSASIAISLSSLIALIPFLMKKTVLRFRRPRFHRAMLRQIVACGSPVFLSNVAGRVTSILMNVLLITMGAKAFGEGGGTTAVAIYAVLMYSSDLCWPLLYGIADSLSPAVGYNWGAKQYGRVRRIVRCGYIGVATVGLLSTSLLFFGARIVAGLFSGKEDLLLRSESVHAIRLFCFAYLFRWFVVMTQSFLSAIEKPLKATVMSLAVAFVLPVALLGALYPLGLDGIWFNFVGVNAAAALIGILLLRTVLKEMRHREREEEQKT